MNASYMVKTYQPRKPNLNLSEKRLKEAALPIQILLQSLRYVVKYEEFKDENFVMPEDENINRWIEELTVARDAVLNMDESKYQKLLTSLDRISFDVTTEFFANREVVYLIYTNYIVINRLIVSGKWRIPEETETHFYKAWNEIAEYLEKSQTEMLERGEKSATKSAGKIIVWLNEKRGMYQ